MFTGKPRNSFIAVLAALSALHAAAAQDKVTAYTDEWPPYVRKAGEDLGAAARIVRLVLNDMGDETDFRYFEYAYSYYLVKTGTAPMSFPYFKTAARKDEVSWSAPLFSVRNRIYYNRRFHDFSSAALGMEEMRFGRVAGYSYGEEIDALMRDPVTFASESEAMEALLADAIDLLPMTDSVASALLENEFPDRRELVRPVSGIESRSALHVIAPRTEAGRAFIAAFNESHARLLREGVVSDIDQSALSAFARKGDIAQLTASEGFPVVVGVDRRDRNKHYAVPQGTRVIVLDWSDRILEPSDTDRLYQTMVDESLVVVLNGPHVGKELFVKNMYLSIVK